MGGRGRLAVGIALIGGWSAFTVANMVWNPHTSSSPPPVQKTATPLSAVSAARPVDSVTVHLGAGRAGSTFTIPQPQGEIVLYRIRAPRSARVEGTAQLPGVTVPLGIRTSAPSAGGQCHARGGFVTCTTGEEGCPMPAGTWRVHLHKLAGPAGNVTIWFRVGQRSAAQTA